MNNTRLLYLLTHAGLIQPQDQQRVQQEISVNKMPVIRYLTLSTILSAQKVLDFCQAQFQLPIYELELSTPPVFHDIFNDDFVYNNRMVILSNLYYLAIVTSDPSNECLIAKLAFVFQKPLILYLVNDDKLECYLKLFYRVDKLEKQLTHVLKHLPEIKDDEPRSSAADEPLSRFMNELILDAKNK